MKTLLLSILAKRSLTWASLSLGACLLLFCTTAKTAIPITEIGVVTQKATSDGDYLQYVPAVVFAPATPLVVVHGTPGDTETALDAAHTMIQRWTAEADARGLLLIAPAFDTANFGGHEGPGGGYRGLFGRGRSADGFLNDIVDSYSTHFASLNNRMFLYGHSAGGQFVNRYVAVHPERIKAAVISAPGTYAFPDPEVPWPNGMADARIRLEWGFPDPPVSLQFRRDPEGWAKAASLPITVVVGALDRSCVKDIPGNLGKDHIERGQAWVLAMNHHARQSGRVGHTAFVLLAGAGHTSAGGMRDAAVANLFRVWGNDGDMPMAGDFNRDGDGDRAVFRPWTRSWYFDYNHDGNSDATISVWASRGDLPVAGDFDRDGFVDDIAVFRPSNRTWYFDYDHDGSRPPDETVGPWGAAGDLPVAGDFDSDGWVDDIAVFRPSNRTWYFDYDHDGSTPSDRSMGIWAHAGDLPFAGDLDGDGNREDVGVYRESDCTIYRDFDSNASTAVPNHYRCLEDKGCLPVVIPRTVGPDEVVLFCSGLWLP